jgi:hypothetical protein
MLNNDFRWTDWFFYDTCVSGICLLDCKFTHTVTGNTVFK